MKEGNDDGVLFFSPFRTEKGYGKDKRSEIFPASSRPHLLERINWRLALLKLLEPYICELQRIRGP